MNKIILNTLLILFLFSCTSKNNNTINNSEELISKDDAKYKLKEQIGFQFSEITTIYDDQSSSDFSNYVEVIKLTESITDYKKLNLSNKEKELLLILEIKKDIILSKYNEALFKIETIYNSHENSNYVKLLKALCLDSLGDKLNSEKEYVKLLNIFKLNGDQINCSDYFLVLILSNKKNDYEICSNYSESYFSLKKSRKIDLVQNYIFAYTNL